MNLKLRYLAVLFVCAFGQQTDAEVIALHQNANDPASEGWTLREADFAIRFLETWD